jgi:integrase
MQFTVRTVEDVVNTTPRHVDRLPVEYAVGLGRLPGNPIPALKWRAPKATETVNPRAVINHRQARALLAAVRRLSPALVAFFAVRYYAALRPSEAVDLRKEALSSPEKGWGELYLSTSAPSASRSWSRSGTRREPRQLKHRGADEVRIVPSPPELTAILRDHLIEHGTTADGRLFRGVRGGSRLARRYVTRAHGDPVPHICPTREIHSGRSSGPAGASRASAASQLAFTVTRAGGGAGRSGSLIRSPSTTAQTRRNARALSRSIPAARMRSSTVAVLEVSGEASSGMAASSTGPPTS